LTRFVLEDQPRHVRGVVEKVKRVEQGSVQLEKIAQRARETTPNARPVISHVAQAMLGKVRGSAQKWQRSGAFGEGMSAAGFVKLVDERSLGLLLSRAGGS